MKRLAKRLDGTRPVTVAMNGGYGGKGVSTVVDVQGFNYNEPAIDKFHKEFPGQADGGLGDRQHGFDARHLRKR